MTVACGGIFWFSPNKETLTCPRRYLAGTSVPLPPEIGPKGTENALRIPRTPHCVSLFGGFRKAETLFGGFRKAETLFGGFREAETLFGGFREAETLFGKPRKKMFARPRKKKYQRTQITDNTLLLRTNGGAAGCVLRKRARPGSAVKKVMTL